MHSVQSAVEEAIKFYREGKIDIAASIYDQILCQIDKPDVNVLFGYGSILVGQEKYGLGISLIQQGLAIYDKYPLAWCNLGVAYKHIGRDDLAENAYQKALALAPGMPEVLAGLGGLYINKARAQEAEAWSRKALTINPDLPAARMNLGVALLEQGRFEEAWPHYEGRWDSLDRMKDKRPYTAPRWNGEPVKVLAIHGEQGLGDEILFMSLFARAKARAQHIVIECADRLVPIFEDSFGAPCYPNHEALIAAAGEPDAYIPMASLPLVLGLPDGKPFLKRPNRTRTGKPVIGIAWRGGTVKTNHRDRTIDLADFAPIRSALDAEFVSLQYGGDEVDAEAHAHGLITGNRDFPALQHRIGICDLVITVCQTAVHQAGAMGVPCWVLTPRHAAWRYSGADMMPWYESIRLFKQDHQDDGWKGVISTVVHELGKMQASQARAA